MFLDEVRTGGMGGEWGVGRRARSCDANYNELFAQIRCRVTGDVLRYKELALYMFDDRDSGNENTRLTLA